MPNRVSFDQFDSWSDSFSTMVSDFISPQVSEHLRNTPFEFIEDAGQMALSDTSVEVAALAIKVWLENNIFLCFHGTRLLDYEAESILKGGLKRLNATSRKERLEQIFNGVEQWPQKSHELDGILTKLGSGEKMGRREGQVHLSLSRSGLENSFNHYLEFGSEFDQHAAYLMLGKEIGYGLLKTSTKPYLVHVSVDGSELITACQPYFSYQDIITRGELPGIASTFLNAWAFKQAYPDYELRKLRTDCCMVFYKDLPAGHIIEVEELSK